MTSPRSLILPFAAALAVAVVGGATAAPSAEAQGPCIQGPKVTKYLSNRVSFGVDHSFARLTWSPEFCPNGKNAWRVIGEPVLKEVGAGSALGTGMDLDAPTRHSIGVTYNGRVRACLPVSAGYAGISYTGKLCNTAANGFVGAYINRQNKVFYRFPTLKGSGLGKRNTWVWTDRVI
jgi:hypothetical protein